MSRWSVSRWPAWSDGVADGSVRRPGVGPTRSASAAVRSRAVPFRRTRSDPGGPLRRCRRLGRRGSQHRCPNVGVGMLAGDARQAEPLRCLVPTGLHPAVQGRRRVRTRFRRRVQPEGDPPLVVRPGSTAHVEKALTGREGEGQRPLPGPRSPGSRHADPRQEASVGRLLCPVLHGAAGLGGGWVGRPSSAASSPGRIPASAAAAAGRTARVAPDRSGARGRRTVPDVGDGHRFVRGPLW